MAITFRDLLKSIVSAQTIRIGMEGVSGFYKGAGIPVPLESSAKSMGWLLEQARAVRLATLKTSSDTNISSMSPTELMRETMSVVKDKTVEGEKVVPPPASVNLTMQAGEMVMFIYDPKTKDKLPYYDTFPLVFPIGIREDGFLGLNMHYLPPTSRANLMDSLYGLLNNTKMDDTTRVQVSYEILQGASKFREYKPCIKRYLSGHIRSARLTVHPSQWDMVLMLPTARFVKADQLRVWNESLNKIRGIK